MWNMNYSWKTIQLYIVNCYLFVAKQDWKALNRRLCILFSEGCSLLLPVTEFWHSPSLFLPPLFWFLVFALALDALGGWSCAEKIPDIWGARGIYRACPVAEAYIEETGAHTSHTKHSLRVSAVYLQRAVRRTGATLLSQNTYFRNP